MTFPWIDEIPDEPPAAGLFVCQKFFEFDMENDREAVETFDVYLEFLCLLRVLVRERFDFNYEQHALPTEASPDALRIIRNLFNSTKDIIEKRQLALSIAQKLEKYNALIGHSFHYEFSDADLSRIQARINELRDLIASCDQLEEDHKRRLLAKLEKLQAELHKRMSDLARFFDLWSDGFLLMKQFGEDVKPIVDRIKEIA